MFLRLFFLKSFEQTRRDKTVQFSDIDTLLQVDRDMTRPGPELELRVEVDDPGILRRVHVDARIGQRVDLSLGSGETLGIPYDDPLVRKDRDIAKRPVSSDSMLAVDKHLVHILREACFGYEGPGKQRG